MKTPTLAVLVTALALAAGGCRTSKTHGPPLEEQKKSSPPMIDGTTGAPRSALAAPAAGGSVAVVEKQGKAQIGAPAPDFTLTATDGKAVRLSDFKNKTVVLEWFSPTCPYSVYAWGPNGPLREMSERLKSQGVVWLTVNSEDPATAAGEVERTRRFAAENSMDVRLLMDPAGKVGRAYEAKSTPHMFVISPRGVLVYRGALDNAQLGKVKDGAAKTNYVESAIRDIAAGHAVTASETKPYG